jgi:hypothetical protein
MKQASTRKEFELTSVRMRAMEMILFRPGVDRAKARTRGRAACQCAGPSNSCAC